MNLFRSTSHAVPSLRPGQKRIHQRRYLLIRQGKIRHVSHRMFDRPDQFVCRPADSRHIKIHRQTVAPSSTDMTAAAGQLLKQLFTCPVQRHVAKDKAGVFTGSKAGMSNIFSRCRRVAQMAVAAPAPPRIMDRMA